MKHGMMKKAAAFMIAFAVAMPGNMAVLAEEETQIAAEAARAEEEARIAAEKEAAARAEEEARIAAEKEAAAKAEEEARIAAEKEAAAKAEEEARIAAEKEAAAKAEEEARIAAEKEAAAKAEEEARIAAEKEAAAKAEEEARIAAEKEAAEKAEEEAKIAAEKEAAKRAEEEAAGETGKTSFEVKKTGIAIKAEVKKEVGLPENTTMHVAELKEGSEEYEAARAATIKDLKTDPDGIYHFYEIIFLADGKEIPVDEQDIEVEIQFQDHATAVRIADNKAEKL